MNKYDIIYKFDEKAQVFFYDIEPSTSRDIDRDGKQVVYGYSLEYAFIFIKAFYRTEMIRAKDAKNKRGIRAIKGRLKKLEADYDFYKQQEGK